MRISDWSSDVCSSDLDHLPHRQNAILVKEHVLGAAEPDALGAEVARSAGIARRLGIGADLEAANLVGERKSVVWGRSVSVRVDLGGRRIIKNKKTSSSRESSSGQYVTTYTTKK